MVKFRIRSVLIGAVLFSLLLCLGIWIHRSNRQRETVRWVCDHDGFVYYDFQSGSDVFDWKAKEYPDRYPKWLVDLLGYDFFCDVVRVDISSNKAVSLQESNIDSLSKLKYISIRERDEEEGEFQLNGIELLSNFRNLEVVDLPSVDDSSLKFLKENRRIKWLMIGSIDQNGLRYFRYLKNLQSLFIIDCSAIEEYQFLDSLMDLERLDLSSCNGFSTAAIKNLKKLKSLSIDGVNSSLKEEIPPELSYLWIKDGSVKDFQFLEAAPKLETLWINDSHIAHWPNPKRIPNLHELYLLSCQFDGFHGFEACPKLNMVYLYDCKIKEPQSILQLRFVEDLTFELFDSIALPSLISLPNIKYLTLGRGTKFNVKELVKLKNLVRVETSSYKDNRKELIEFLKARPDTFFK